MKYDCETTRDLLPALALGRASAFEADAAGSHLSECDDCADELRVVRMLQDGLAELPAGLEMRVLRAVRHAPPQRWSLPRLAMAATVAATLIGGSVVVQRAGYLSGSPISAPAVVVAEPVTLTSWDADADPLLHGASELHEMSEEELEMILAELES